MRRLLPALVLAGLIAAATGLNAQEQPAQPAPEPNGSDDLRRRVGDLERDVADLKSRTSQHDRDIETLARGVLANETAINTHTADINSNRDNIAELRRRANDNDLKFRDIARFDSQSGGYVPNILGNMQKSASFRQEVGQATQGRVVIENESRFDQFLYINGVRWRVLPGRSSAPVARGPVTIQRSPFAPREVLNEWSADANGHYVQYRLPTAGFDPLIGGLDPLAGVQRVVAGRPIVETGACSIRRLGEPYFDSFDQQWKVRFRNDCDRGATVSVWNDGIQYSRYAGAFETVEVGIGRSLQFGRLNWSAVDIHGNPSVPTR